MNQVVQGGCVFGFDVGAAAVVGGAVVLEGCIEPVETALIANKIGKRAVIDGVKFFQQRVRYRVVVDSHARRGGIAESAVADVAVGGVSVDHHAVGAAPADKVLDSVVIVDPGGNPGAV